MFGPMSELHITVNGQARAAAAGTTVSALLASMGVDPTRVAIERNEEVVPRTTWNAAALAEGDRLEIVSFVGGGSEAAAAADAVLVIAGRTNHSRRLVGTGKYRTIEEGREAI